MEVTTLVRTVGLDLLKPALPQRQLDGHKGTFGKLLIVGGAVGYTGARPISPRRRRHGPAAGWCRWGCRRPSGPSRQPNVSPPCPFRCRRKTACWRGRLCRKFLEKLDGCDVLALGPGLGRSRETARLVWELLKTENRWCWTPTA